MTADLRPPRRRLPVAVALLLVVALLAFGGTSSSGSATAADDVRAGGRADVGMNGPERPARRLSRVVVVDHNIERRPSALTAALRHAARVGARMITLQEVCWWQVRDLRELHPDWAIVYQPDNRSGRCTDRRILGSLSARIDSGNVAIRTEGSGTRASTHVFRPRVNGRGMQGIACLHWQVRISVDLCSTHLLHAGELGPDRRVLLRQARALGAFTRRLNARGHLVVLGGDLNAGPVSRPLDFLYAVGGQGRMVEATGCPVGVPRCRRTRRITRDGGRQKIDYVFFSANRTPPGTAHGLTITRTLSDHHMLTGWAMVDTRPAASRPTP